VNYDDLIPVIRTLAIEAGNKIMEIYNSDDFEVKTKSDDSPVTAADEAADDIISAGLRGWLKARIQFAPLRSKVLRASKRRPCALICRYVKATASIR